MEFSRSCSTSSETAVPLRPSLAGNTWNVWSLAYTRQIKKTQIRLGESTRSNATRPPGAATEPIVLRASPRSDRWAAVLKMARKRRAADPDRPAL